MIINDLAQKKLIQPPKWLLDNVIYAVLGGSYLYNMQTEASDWDIKSICIPKKEDVFPHLRGEIIGFGKQQNRFEQFQQHGIIDPEANGGKGREYDIEVMNIVKYFQLAMDANPSVLEILFAPHTCILHDTQISQVIRENRKLFLSTKVKFTYLGYAYSMIHKAKTKNPEGKRKEIVAKYGWDCKYGAHCWRLLAQGTHLLSTGDLNPQIDSETCKSIRRGDLSLERVEEMFREREDQMEKLYANSPLPHSPDEPKIKSLLLGCLNMWYKDVYEIVRIPGESERIIREIHELTERFLSQNRG